MNVRSLAKAVGMSHMTVSRALNGSPHVAPATRERVLRLAQELGYEIHGPARGLATGKTGTVGILYPFHRLREIESWYTAQLMHDIRISLDDAGLDSIINGYDTATNGVEDISRLVSQRKVDALVVIGNEVSREALDTLADRHIRYLCINPPNEDWIYGHSAVMIDQALGGQLAAQALQEYGCTRVGTLMEGAPQFSHRLSGFRRIWENHLHLRLPDGLYRSAYQTITNRIASGELPLDGLFVGSDVSALGAMNAIQDAGLQVPEDIAIIGFDDIDSASYSRPGLTTIHQPRSEVARAAAEWVKMEQSQIVVSPPLVLKPWLIARGSCP